MLRLENIYFNVSVVVWGGGCFGGILNDFTEAEQCSPGPLSSNGI